MGLFRIYKENIILNLRKQNKEFTKTKYIL